jgi:flavin reductase (DIM6/NTAB) family NADH-FMN oxidoreductase RutF
MQDERRRIMKKSLGPQPTLFPMPVLIIAAYDEDGVPCAMNAAWGTISGMDKVALCIDEGHKTVKNIRATGAFTVALADRAHMVEADYFGIATGNKVADKFAQSGMSATKSELVNAPVIDEFPLTMVCELAEVVQTEHTHMVVGTIVDVLADEAVLDGAGKVDPAKLDVLIFDQFQRGYYVAGERVGGAWNAGSALAKAVLGK